MNKVREEADKLRYEAKQHLNALLEIPEGFSSGIVERFVDCTIGAAILELTAIQQEALRKVQRRRTGGGN